ncbi:MAG: type II secretion system protein [Clostridia bacterium]|nr:type II secretion system protein [Clostridia bacterium]
MMHKRKRGFTIVELIIVIAIIGVLAAVLIPTFNEVMQKAKMSADTAECASMNHVLKLYESFSDVVFVQEVLEAEGFSLVCRNSKTHRYWYDSETNTMLLLSIKELLNVSRVAYADSFSNALLPEAFISAHPGYWYADKTDDVISSALGTIWNLAKSTKENKVAAFEESVSAVEAEYPTVATHLNKFHPDKTVYLSDTAIFTEAESAAEQVVFTKKITTIRVTQNLPNITCSVTLPQTVQTVSQSFLNACESVEMHREITVIEEEIPDNPNVGGGSEEPENPPEAPDPELPEEPENPPVVGEKYSFLLHNDFQWSIDCGVNNSSIANLLEICDIGITVNNTNVYQNGDIEGIGAFVSAVNTTLNALDAGVRVDKITFTTRLNNGVQNVNKNYLLYYIDEELTQPQYVIGEEAGAVGSGRKLLTFTIDLTSVEVPVAIVIKDFATGDVPGAYEPVQPDVPDGDRFSAAEDFFNGLTFTRVYVTVNDGVSSIKESFDSRDRLMEFISNLESVVSIVFDFREIGENGNYTLTYTVDNQIFTMTEKASQGKLKFTLDFSEYGTDLIKLISIMK